MRDILIDGLPIMDLLEVNPSTCEVAEWSRCNQSSVSRIYRHVSGCLDLGFRKAGGVYQAHRNQELLLALRQAAQLRRLSKGCQQHLQWVGDPWNGLALSRLGDAMPMPRWWLGEHRTLHLLQRRVIDLAVIRGLEILPPGWGNSHSPFYFGDWAAVGLVRQPVELAARPDHPLCRREGLLQQELTGLQVLTASPDPFPVQSRSLQRLGLHPHRLRIDRYCPSQWEGGLAGELLLPTTPISRWAVPHLELTPLPIATGITEMDLVLVARDLLLQPPVQDLINAIREAYRQAYAHLPGLVWL